MNSMVAIWEVGDSESGNPQHVVGLPAASHGWEADWNRFGPWRPGEFPGSGNTSLPCVSAQTKSRGGPVLVCGPCTSTFDVAWNLMGQNLLPVWGAVLALSQNSGRGQLRRPWHSPPGNVYAALRLPGVPANATQQSEIPPDMLPLLVGVAAAEVLEELEVSVQVKWPNDLLLTESKIGGILIEVRGPREGGVDVVVGLGLNLVHAPPQEMLRGPEALPGASLAGVLADTGPLSMWLALHQGIRRVLESFSAMWDDSSARDRIEHRLAWLGREVELRDGPFDKTRGIVLGIDGLGALRLHVQGREQIFRSGSVYPVTGQGAE